MRIFITLLVVCFSLNANAGFKDLFKSKHLKKYEKQREALDQSIETDLDSMTFEDDLSPSYIKEVARWNYWIEKVDAHRLSVPNNSSTVEKVLKNQSSTSLDKYFIFKDNEKAISEYASCMLYQLTNRKDVVSNYIAKQRKEAALVYGSPYYNDFTDIYKSSAKAWPESKEKSVEYCDSWVFDYYTKKQERRFDTYRAVKLELWLKHPSLKENDLPYVKDMPDYEQRSTYYRELWLDKPTFDSTLHRLESDLKVAQLKAQEQAKKAELKRQKAERLRVERDYKKIMQSSTGSMVYEGCDAMIGRPMKNSLQIELKYMKDPQQKQVLRDQTNYSLKRTCTCWTNNLVNAGHSSSDLKRIARLMKVLSPQALAYDPMGMEIAKAGTSCVIQDMGI